MTIGARNSSPVLVRHTHSWPSRRSLGHLRHGEDLVSIDLLVGGISLGLCLLAGGPLAFVVVAALLVLVLGHFEPPPDPRRATAVRRGHVWSGWPAFRSLGVLVATAFAAGGWWELMMLYSYGGQFPGGLVVGDARLAVEHRPMPLYSLRPEPLRCDCCMSSSRWRASCRA